MKEIDQIRNLVKCSAEDMQTIDPETPEYAILDGLVNALLRLTDLYEKMDNEMYRVMNPNP